MQDGLKRVFDYSDYLATPDDGKRYEILRGKLLVTPAPRPLHQRVVGRLYRLLADYFDRHGGEVFLAPIDLILTNNDILQPDLLVVDNEAVVTERGIEGPPLLAVEVLSPTTAKRDRGVKSQRYAELGIRHYWLVDPDARRMECFDRAGSVFEKTVELEGDAVGSVAGFPGLEVSLPSLWRTTPPAPRRG